jgi:type VI secretion system secreted protein Hcp
VRAEAKSVVTTAPSTRGVHALTCRRRGGKDRREFLRITLSDVLVASYQTSGQADDSVPVDQVTFTYAQVNFEYWLQKADGSLGAPVTAGWDLKTNESLE